MNLVGEEFGEWKVLRYSGNNKWRCKCSCGTEKDVRGDSLIRKESLSCGHYRNQDRIIDISGQTFGEWKVLEYINKGFWKCQCSCGAIKSVYSRALRTGNSMSCGHLSTEKFRKTMLDRYGDIAPNRINSPREERLIHIVNNKDKLVKFIESYGYKPTIDELCKDLDVTKSYFRNKIHSLRLDSEVRFLESVSDAEISLRRYVQSICTSSIIYNSRDIITPYEIDIYIPDRKLAIEFNGNYWHSTAFKDKYYHQRKTLECAKQGIRLIHVYEYEWEDTIVKNVIKNIIKNALIINNVSVDLDNVIISNATKNEILEINKMILHKVNDNNNVICAKYEGNIVGFMELDRNYIHNMLSSNKDIIKAMLKYINSGNILDEVYIDLDIGKFFGKTLTEVGFTSSIKDVTEPKLIYKKLGNEIYGSGFLKMRYKYKY